MHNENTGARQMKAAAENMENVPIFRSDDDKTEFEACIDVDLSQVCCIFFILEARIFRKGSKIIMSKL